MISLKVTANLAGAMAIIFGFYSTAPAQESSSQSIVGLYVPKLPEIEPSLRFGHFKQRIQGRFDVPAQPHYMQAQPQAYCFEDLALFCKMEVKLEKTFRFPIRMRLGDVPYVDWLEGKRRNY